MTEKQTAILRQYQQELNQIQQEVRSLQVQINKLSFLRLAIFIGMIALIFFLVQLPGLLVGVELALLLLFVFLISKQSKMQETLRFKENTEALLQNELQHLQDGTNAYDNGLGYADARHPYSDDLDIFGQSSLYHYINRCKTNYGKDELARWLNSSAEKSAIEERQSAVEELTNHIPQSLAIRAQLWPHPGETLPKLAAALQLNLKQYLAFTEKRWLRFYVKFVPLILLALVGAAFFDSRFWGLFILVLIFNFLLTGVFSGKINRVYSSFDQSSRKLSAYAQVFEWIENGNWQSAYLKDLLNQSHTRVGGKSTPQQIKSLGEILSAFDYRLNFLIGPLLNFFALWDIRCAIRLANWYDQSSQSMVRSFEVLGTFEALISLATLKHNHPDWSLPEIKANFSFSSTDLGHPLIRYENRINNNYRFMQLATVDIITGSNMAGKSTFLRTVGVNMVLAYAGAVVCATSMELSVMHLLSYMRIKDSLNESTSTFKAELDRLKMILEVTGRDPHALVLIDEMLRGTNSKDKYTGSKAFIERLIRQKTAALVATHDLQIADLADVHQQLVRNFHFDIQMKNQDMFFDYKIKDGECQTFNALLLLKAIGLDVKEN